MKIILCLIITLGALTTLCAADFTYDIGNFRPTNLWQYYLSPYYTNSTSYNRIQEDESSLYFTNRLGISGGLNIDKPKFTLSISSMENGSLVSQKNSNLIYKDDKDASSAKLLYSSNRIEYRKYRDQFFLGIDYTGTYDLGKVDEKYHDNYDEYSQKYHTRNWDVFNQVSGLIGTGRLYECQEAYMSWYYFTELDKYGCLSRDYTSADIDQLAETLYKLRSLHEIDSRKNFIKKTTILLEDLEAKDFVQASSHAKATAIIMDLWTQGSAGSRLVGSRIEARPFGSLESYKKTQHNEYEYSTSDVFTARFYDAQSGMELSFKNELPYHNIYQLSSELSAKQGWYDAFYKYDEDYRLSMKWKSYTHLYGSYTVSYFPDCRKNYIAIGANSSVKFNNYDNNLNYGYFDDIFGHDLPYSDVNLIISAEYLLNYRTSIYAEIKGTYMELLYKSNSVAIQKNVSAYVDIRYQIF